MEILKRKCSRCDSIFETLKFPSSNYCQKCICLRQVEYYHKNKTTTQCECGKVVLEKNLNKHLSSALHKRWLTQKPLMNVNNYEDVLLTRDDLYKA